MKKSTSLKLPAPINYYKYYLLLIIIVLLVFGNSISNGYNMDDNLVTQNHPLTSQKGISTVANIFTNPYFKDEMGNSYGYRPIVVLSFFIEHSIFGESPKVSHFFNLLFYGLAIVLFFRLLIKWFGENGLILALLSTLFFAVHPIHTEVVDSIKNRDEILAFLFVILAGLSIDRYLRNNTWGSLFAILAFFTLGILSKKSVYPMVLILPVAVIFFKEITLKELVFISIAMILPAAIIASNLEIKRFVILFYIPIGGILLMFYLRTGIQIDNVLKKTNSIYLYSIVSWVLTGITIWNRDFGYFLLPIPFLLLIIKKQEYPGIIQLVLQLALIGFFLNIDNLSKIAFAISIGYLVYLLSNKKMDWGLLLLSALVSLLLSSQVDSITILIVFLVLVVFFYLTFKRGLWGLLFITFIIILHVSFFDLVLFHFILFAFSILYFISLKWTSYNFIYNSTGIIIVLSLFYTANQSNYSPRPGNTAFHSSIEQKNTPPNGISKNNAFAAQVMKEGRMLEYVENSLITPHTLSETIGTGFTALGTYFKLMVFPKELSFYYGYSKIKTTGLYNWEVWFSIIVHLGLIILAIWQVKIRPVLTMGIAWYLLSVLLFSNWAELVAGMVGERLAFTASAGFSIFMASLILWIKPDFSFTKPRVLELAVLTILLILSVRTIARNSEWKDPITLMGNDIKHLTNSAQANNLYAIFLMKEASENNKLGPEAKQAYRIKAIEHFKKAISISPSFYNANFDLGRAYIVINDFKNSKAAFKQTFKIDPTNVLALEELTKTSFDLKQKFDTEYYGNMYLQKAPNNENIHELLAYIMLINNDKAKAKEYAERGLKYYPNNRNLQLILVESLK